MSDRKQKKKQRGSGRMWWLSGLFVVALALLVTKLTLNLGFLILNHGHGPAHWTAPFDVWAKNASDKAPATTAQATGSTAGPENAISAMQYSGAQVGDLMAHLDKREAELNRREKELRQKEQYLNQMQAETEKKLKELISVQEEIQSYHDAKKTAEANRMKSLIKIYENMKPKGAAKLLESLDQQLAVKIISQMDTNLAATILANMDHAKAVEISKALTAPQ